jgi:hypothetical protein
MTIDIYTVESMRLNSINIGNRSIESVVGLGAGILMNDPARQVQRVEYEHKEYVFDEPLLPDSNEAHIKHTVSVDCDGRGLLLTTICDGINGEVQEVIRDQRIDEDNLQEAVYSVIGGKVIMLGVIRYEADYLLE